jgi:hypothetical protein
MDTIDIVDPTFALDAMANTINNQLADVVASSSSSASYLYVGGLLLLLLVGMLVYKVFGNKRNTNDCSGGFCTIGQSHQGEGGGQEQEQ